VNCRLPQTPRTPSTAAAHYFDDIFTRQKTMYGRNEKPHHLRRSSTSRSIGMRSDWNDEEDDDIDSHSDSRSTARANSIYLDEETLKKKAEMDEHVAHYVADQLERMKSNDSASQYQDEIEAQLDGVNGH
ncbi:hypothetical protein LTR04_005022, partial [Oleoguttula sp. CCFEE 6159]